ncbi:hypothetical protein QJS04_geneDACA001608 [Acorus gramineus]|uniref:ATP-dependent Clp protease proteolytic subunit n=1 Tax=Acorus gramineus TaxID=55184 RepID=A0AAV9BK80_ACOGR|nr:hypothetical protein QJS04_geneDACA001608 [Acorus gramineus]
MAASMLASNLGSTSSSSGHLHELDFDGSLGLSKLSCLGRSGLISSAFPSLKRHVSLKRRSVSASASAGGANYDHIPKQFREENLKEGYPNLVGNIDSFLIGSNAKELDANTDYYIELLSKGIGKPKEEIAKDIQRPKYFQAQEAIAYGIADKIIDSRDAAFEKRNYDEMLAQSRAMRRGAGAGPQAAPSGFS